MAWLKILSRASIAARRSSCMVLRSIPLGDAAEDAAGGVEGDGSKPGAEKAGVPASPAAAAGPLGVGGASPKPDAEGVPEGARVA
eukprot:4606031-Heterocapsa_arctica.AAC.1